MLAYKQENVPGSTMRWRKLPSCMSSTRSGELEVITWFELVPNYEPSQIIYLPCLILEGQSFCIEK